MSPASPARPPHRSSARTVLAVVITLGTLTAGLVLGAGALRLWEDYLAGDPSAPSGTICANDCPPELVSTVASGARLTLPPGTTVQAYAAPRGAHEGFTARLLLPRGSASPVLGSDAEETYSTHPDGYEGDDDAIDVRRLKDEGLRGVRGWDGGPVDGRVYALAEGVDRAGNRVVLVDVHPA